MTGREVQRAHVECLIQWAQGYDNDTAEGSKEVAMLMRRAAKLLTAIANDEPVVFVETPLKAPDVAEVREDDTVDAGGFTESAVA